MPIVVVVAIIAFSMGLGAAVLIGYLLAWIEDLCICWWPIVRSKMRRAGIISS